MLRPFRISNNQKRKLFAAAREAPLSSPRLLTTGGLLGAPPKGFAHDLSRSGIGKGPRIFFRACEALKRWEQFDLGWVRVADPIPAILPGQLVAVEAHAGCFWSMNFSRITEVVNSPNRFGFMYTTTSLHVEEGQECFVINFDPETEFVSYLIQAVSRPRHPLARVGYPFSRSMQRRFARDSHARMKLAAGQAPC